MLWSSPHELFGANFPDIYGIEVAGPLLILARWPGLLAKSLRVHNIDKVAARALHVCGLSSVTAADDVVSLTWELMAQPRTVPWFDCVDTPVIL